MKPFLIVTAWLLVAYVIVMGFVFWEEWKHQKERRETIRDKRDAFNEELSRGARLKK